MFVIKLNKICVFNSLYLQFLNSHELTNFHFLFCPKMKFLVKVLSVFCRRRPDDVSGLQFFVGRSHGADPHSYASTLA